MILRKNSIRIPVVHSSREPTLAFLVGLSVALLIAFAVFGCKDGLNTTSALDVANKALVGVDVAADTLVANVVQLREDRVRACKEQNLATEQERADCMGKLAEPLQPKAKAAAAAYDATVRALAELANAIEALEELTR